MTAVGGWSLALSQPREAALEPALIASVAAVTSMIPQGLALMTTIAFAVSALVTVRYGHASVWPEPVRSFGLLHRSVAFCSAAVSHPFWKSPCQLKPVGSLWNG